MTIRSDTNRKPVGQAPRRSRDGVRPARSLIAEAARRLRTDIMTGALRPGQKLVEADISTRLGISRASVREVLRALQGERLIELVPNKGPSVANLGMHEIDDIEQVWMLLTADAVARFAATRRDQDIVALRQRLKILKATLAKSLDLEAIDAINAFFWYVMQRCGNVVLLDVVVSLVSRLNFLRAQSLREVRWRARCASEIGAILQALNAGNQGSARRATAAHIVSTCQAARDVAMSYEKREAGRAFPDPPRSPPRIPLDEYLDRGLADGKEQHGSPSRRFRRG